MAREHEADWLWVPLQPVFKIGVLAQVFSLPRGGKLLQSKKMWGLQRSGSFAVVSTIAMMCSTLYDGKRIVGPSSRPHAHFSQGTKV